MGMNVLRDSPARTWGSEGAREGGKEDGGKEGARRNINMQPSQDTLCVMYIKRGLAHANVQPRLVINMSLAIPRVTLLAFDWAPRRSFESREGGRGGEKKNNKTKQGRRRRLRHESGRALSETRPRASSVAVYWCLDCILNQAEEETSSLSLARDS